MEIKADIAGLELIQRKLINEDIESQINSRKKQDEMMFTNNKNENIRATINVINNCDCFSANIKNILITNLLDKLTY